MVNFDELMKQLQAVSIFPGITPVDILALPDPVDSAVQKILRRGPMGVAESHRCAGRCFGCIYSDNEQHKRPRQG